MFLKDKLVDPFDESALKEQIMCKILKSHLSARGFKSHTVQFAKLMRYKKNMPTCTWGDRTDLQEVIVTVVTVTYMENQLFLLCNVLVNNEPNLVFLNNFFLDISTHDLKIDVNIQSKMRSVLFHTGYGVS